MDVRVTCPDCGDMLASANDMLAITNTDTQQNTASFKCAQCGLRSSTEITASELQKLISGRAKRCFWHWPAELSEPRPDGEPFDRANLIDFHQALLSERWVEASMRGCHATAKKFETK